MDKKSNVKKWYLHTFPKDEWSSFINRNITFEDVFNALGVDDIYSIIGNGTDSIIREHIFIQTAKIYGYTYEMLLKKWLKLEV